MQTDPMNGKPERLLSLYALHSAHETPVRRFPPVLQFLTRSSPHVEREIRARTLEAFRRGKSIEQICSDIYRTALECSFYATIGVQEVSSRSMPSFPEETVVSALLMIDLRYDPEIVITEPRRTGT
ncbi:MAG TPA: hypothetical protein VF190_14925 [Rhodothermales bacterium]